MFPQGFPTRFEFGPLVSAPIFSVQTICEMAFLHALLIIKRLTPAEICC